MPFIKKIKNQAGFTLTEVMIGIMILTVAIVSATNLLIGLIDTNRNNLSTLQAYYFAQEGIEAVRNIRDTNWLHNNQWLGNGSEALWGESFFVSVDGSEKAYGVDLQYGAFVQPESGEKKNNLSDLGFARTWRISSSGDGGEIFYLGADENGSKPSGFKRVISIKSYDCSEVVDICLPEDQAKYVLVESRVTWKLGSRDRELQLSAVLTDWKGGAL